MADVPIRVLHVLGNFTGGGIQTMLMDLLRARDRERFAVDVCVLAETPGELAGAVEELGCRVHACAPRKSPLTFTRRLEVLIRAGRYHVVHVHRSSSLMAFPLMAARRAGVRVRVAHYHNILDRSQPLSPRLLAAPFLRRRVVRDATHIIGVSSWVLDTHFGTSWREDKQFRVVPNAIDLDRFGDVSRRGSIRAEFGFADSEVVVGHVARFSEAKNHAAIVEIAAALPCDAASVQFLLVGEGPLRAGIERQVRERNLEGRVHFAGWRADMPGMLSAMDLFLFPSRWEGLPMALIEAQAAGIPCVTSDLPCIGEVLHGELWANRFALGELSLAVSRIQALANNPVERMRLGELARDHSRNFDIRVLARRIESIHAGESFHS